MAPPTTADEDAAVARVDAAYGQRDVAAITAELKAHLSSARVVSRSCHALLGDTLVRAAAASADVLLLVLEAVRRHVEYGEVPANACLLAAELVKSNTVLAGVAVEREALQLALARHEECSGHSPRHNYCSSPPDF